MDAYKILGLDGNTLSVDGSQVGVLEEGDKVCLRSLLEGHDGRRLEAQVRLLESSVSQHQHRYAQFIRHDRQTVQRDSLP